MHTHELLTQTLYDQGRVHSPHYSELYKYEQDYILLQLTTLQFWR